MVLWKMLCKANQKENDNFLVYVEEKYSTLFNWLLLILWENSFWGVQRPLKLMHFLRLINRVAHLYNDR